MFLFPFKEFVSASCVLLLLCTNDKKKKKNSKKLLVDTFLTHKNIFKFFIKIV